MMISYYLFVKPASHRGGPDSFSVHVGYVVDKVAMGLVVL